MAETCLHDWQRLFPKEGVEISSLDSKRIYAVWRCTKCRDIGGSFLYNE